ncbi:MAG: DUF4147 domain-containing protein [Labilithrix sp.]|nr:DUF4147 domain-containing protein [Labilithrix sp.]
MSRRAVEDAVRRALARLAPSARVAGALPDRPPRAGAPRRSGAPRAVSVVAIGKAAPSMARGAIERWGDAIADVLVVTTDGTDVASVARDPRVEILVAAHPLPDRRSARAAERCLARARSCADRDRLLLVLVSGGASSLVCAPSDGVSLRDKRAVTRAMIASGASIQEINVVRKHLSRIKGGGLARAAFPARVVTLASSDVIDGAIADVGSGPSVADASSVARARRLLARYAPRYAALPLAATGRAPNAAIGRIVASPEELARAVARELRAPRSEGRAPRGEIDSGGARAFRVRVLEPSQGSVDRLAREYVEAARHLRAGTAIVRAAEPSLAVPDGAGRGGRSTHLAALVGLELPRGATFLAAATDGVDGASGTGGAVVDATFVRRAGEAAVRRALARYDAGALHLAAKTALPLRPSGHNLADIHVLAMT